MTLKKHLLICSVLLISILSAIHSNVDIYPASASLLNEDVLWVHQSGGTGGDIVNAVGSSKDGKYVYATGQFDDGSSGTANDHIDAFILGFDENGDSRSECTQISNRAGLWDETYAVAVDDDGEFFVGGAILTDGVKNGTEGWLVAYDKFCNFLWERNLYSTSGDSSTVYELAIDSTGAIIAYGQPTFAWDYWVAKYSATGNLLWSKEYEHGGVGGDNHSPSGIAVDAADNIYLLGDGNLSSQELTKLDWSGEEVWQINLRDHIEQDRTALGYRMGLNDQHGIYITGYATDGYFIANFDHNGSKQWEKTYVDSDVPSISNMGVSTDGFIYVQSGNNIVAHEPDATFIWKKNPRPSASTADMNIRSLIVNDRDELFLGGWTTESWGNTHAGSFDTLVLQLDTGFAPLDPGLYLEALTNDIELCTDTSVKSTQSNPQAEVCSDVEKAENQSISQLDPGIKQLLIRMKAREEKSARLRAACEQNVVYSILYFYSYYEPPGDEETDFLDFIMLEKEDGSLFFDLEKLYDANCDRNSRQAQNDPVELPIKIENGSMGFNKPSSFYKLVVNAPQATIELDGVGNIRTRVLADSLIATSLNGEVLINPINSTLDPVMLSPDQQVTITADAIGPIVTLQKVYLPIAQR